MTEFTAADMARLAAALDEATARFEQAAADLVAEEYKEYFEVREPVHWPLPEPINPRIPCEAGRPRQIASTYG